MFGRATIEYDVARQLIVYRKRSRRVEVRCDVDDGWWIRPASIGWWDGDGDARSPVSAAERETIIAEILADGRKHGRWIGLAGEPRPERALQPSGDVVDQVQDELDAFSPPVAIPDPELILRIDEALAYIEPLAPQWDVAASITRQLRWCRGTVNGEAVETPPGPLSMGLMATREFDMYGSQPEFASLINRIQDAMRARGSNPGR